MSLYSNAQGKKGLLYKGKLGEASAKVPEYELSSLRDTRLISGILIKI